MIREERVVVDSEIEEKCRAKTEREEGEELVRGGDGIEDRIDKEAAMAFHSGLGELGLHRRKESIRAEREKVNQPGPI
jgi:hypothetical protein